MSAVVEHKQQTGVATRDQEATAFVQMLERASRDPGVDVDKLERLLQMHERVTARNAEVAFNEAFAAMQTELPEMPERGTVKNKTGGVQSKYALWEDINDIIKPILSKHGFALGFRIGHDNGKPTVTGVLRHRAGHSDACTMLLPLDTSGAKNDVQGVGSSTSYGKRYVAGALLNLTSRGQDDDGAGGKIHKLSEAERADWMAKIGEVSTQAESESVWSQIAAMCQERGDVDAFSELRGAMAKRKAAIGGAK